MGTSGLEPPTSRLSGVRSNHLSYAPIWSSVSLLSLSALAQVSLSYGGDEEDRTPDPLLAKQVLSQLSYTPIQSIRFHFVPLSSSLFGNLKIKQYLLTNELTRDLIRRFPNLFSIERR